MRTMRSSNIQPTTVITAGSMYSYVWWVEFVEPMAETVDEVARLLNKGIEDGYLNGDFWVESPTRVGFVENVENIEEWLPDYERLRRTTDPDVPTVLRVALAAQAAHWLARFLASNDIPGRFIMPVVWLTADEPFDDTFIYSGGETNKYNNAAFAAAEVQS